MAVGAEKYDVTNKTDGYLTWLRSRARGEYRPLETAATEGLWESPAVGIQLIMTM